MLEVRQTKQVDPGTLNKMYTRTGYLFFMEKKALGTAWQKCYCQYVRENRLFCMIPYNQNTGKITSTETFRLKSCVRRMSDSIDKRFCFDVMSEDRPGVVYTLQAQSEEDRALWLDAMDGKEPMYAHPPGGKPSNADQTFLDEAGFNFITKALEGLEKRGLEDQGLYRVVGVASKVTKLLTMGLDRRKSDKLNFDDAFEWETKTITSAVKTFFRNLPEPIMTFSLHSRFIEAAKCDSYSRRLSQIHRLVQQLPSPNQRMLEILLSHLANVVEKSDKNLMTVSNLGVCFGPTLFRAEEETVAAITDIKFTNVVVEIMIGHWETLLRTKPDSRPPPKPAHSGSTPTQATPPAAASPPVAAPPPYIPPPPPSHNSPPTLVQTVIFDGPKVQSAVGSTHTSGSTLPGPPHNGPTYATWERTLRGAPPPAPPPQATQSHRGSVSSSLSNLSSVSSMSTPTSQPWYRASQPRIASARAAHLSEKLGHSTGPLRPSHLSDKLSGYDTSTTARSSRGSSSSSTDSP